MPKKRKVGGGGSGTTQENNDGRRYKMKVDHYMDVANSEDEWDHEQDKLLLESDGRSAKRRRQQEEEDMLEESEVEVLGMSDSDENEEEEYSEGEDVEHTQLKGSKKDHRKAGNDIALSDDEFDDESRNQTRPEDEEGWDAGDAYGADVAENEEDAREIEAEAIRLQKKRLEGLTDADFGLDEDEWMDGEEDGEEERGAGLGGKITEVLPLAEIAADMPQEERLRILTSRYPEFEPLAREFVDHLPLAKELSVTATAALQRTEKRRKRSASLSGVQSVDLRTPTAVLKSNSLSAYMAALAIYFALLTSPAADTDAATQVAPMDPKDLRQHSIMDALVKHKTLWERARDLSDSEDEGMSDEELESADGEFADPSNASVYFTPKEESFADRLPEMMREKKAKKLSKAQQAALEAHQAAKAKQKERLRKLDEDLARVDKSASLIRKRQSASTSAESKKPLKKRHHTADDDDAESDFEDAVLLTAEQALAKERRKKSLRFYTSQIAQKANKRSAASRNAGGDEDIPYRERDKDRQARLNAEAEARARKEAHRKGATDPDAPGASDSEGSVGPTNADRLAAGVDDDDGYYQTIASSKNAAKAAKAARNAAAQATALRERNENILGVPGEDGKRAIGYAIDKNKGLTANRRKDVRNPRVKKRKRFEEKKRKLASTRAVYKGGEGRGGYKGEMRGIKSNLVRSVKL